MTDTLPTAAEYEALATEYDESAQEGQTELDADLKERGPTPFSRALESSIRECRIIAQALRAAAGGGVTMPPASEFGFVVIVPERVSMRDDIRVVIHGHEHRLGFQRDDGAYELLPLNIPPAPSQEKSAAEMREAAAMVADQHSRREREGWPPNEVYTATAAAISVAAAIRALPLTRGSI